jgi:phospholipase A-2-activating protein
VAVCAASGDIVSGASDGVIRIFTRHADRVADEETISQFEESVKSSSIPQQQMGGQINKEKLDGPDWLKIYSGKKEGEIKMVKEDGGSVSAHQWSMSRFPALKTSLV